MDTVHYLYQNNTIYFPNIASPAVYSPDCHKNTSFSLSDQNTSRKVSLNVPAHRLIHPNLYPCFPADNDSYLLSGFPRPILPSLYLQNPEPHFPAPSPNLYHPPFHYRPIHYQVSVYPPCSHLSSAEHLQPRKRQLNSTM